MRQNPQLVLTAAQRILTKWVNQQGHNRCWYYPDVFDSLCDLLGVNRTDRPVLPPRPEFRRGCLHFEDQQFGKLRPSEMSAVLDNVRKREGALAASRALAKDAADRFYDRPLSDGTIEREAENGRIADEHIRARADVEYDIEQLVSAQRMALALVGVAS